MAYSLIIAAITVSVAVFLHAYFLKTLYRLLAHTTINHAARMGMIVCYDSIAS